MRFVFQLIYRPWWCGDSAGYAAPYYLWLHHTFSDAGRTQVYPLFLGLAQWMAGTFAAYCLVESFHKQCGEPQLGMLVVCGAYTFYRLLGWGAVADPRKYVKQV